MAIKIIDNLCVGCGLCVKVCAFDALEMSCKKAVLKDGCTACMACVEKCPFNAIEKLETAGPAKDLSEYKGVWVYAEQRDGVLEPVAIELLGEGRKIADEIGTTLSAVLIGSNVDHIAEELAVHSADSVFVVDRPELKDFSTDAYTTVISDLANDKKPEIILVGATTLGRDLAPRVSARLQTGLTADCTRLEVDAEDNKLKQTRPAFGGNVMATIVCPNHRPQMSTVRPGVMEKAVRNEAKKAVIEKIDVEVSEKDLVVKIVDKLLSESNEIPLTEAPVIVSGGRGVTNKEGFELLGKLADKLGGVVAGSRASVDNGFIAHSKQVGQTGTTVRPGLYFACGISGAIQHVAGMQDSECIVAINKDPDAAIFKVADFGIVGDINDVIPSIISELESRN